MIVGVCRVTLLAPQCHSLKQRRSVMRKIKDRLGARHRIALAEVGGQDTWQRLVLGFSLVGLDRDDVTRQLGALVGAIEAMGLAQLVSAEREVLCYGDEPFGERMSAGQAAMDEGAEQGVDESWIPAEWLAGEGERDG